MRTEGGTCQLGVTDRSHVVFVSSGMTELRHCMMNVSLAVMSLSKCVTKCHIVISVSQAMSLHIKSLLVRH